MITSRIPLARYNNKFHRMSGVPPTGNKGLGIVLVNGRRRVPRPAAKIMAFIRKELAPFRNIRREMGEQPMKLGVFI